MPVKLKLVGPEGPGPDGKEYWLPETFHLHLTALEAGALFAILQLQSLSAINEFKIRVKGREEEVPIREVILEKMERARREMDRPKADLPERE